MVAVQLVAQFLIPDEPRSAITPISAAQFWFGYIFPVPRLFEFVLGILLARIVLAGRWLPISIGQAAALSLLGYVAALYVPFLYGFVVATIVPVGALICAVATADLQGRRTLLGTRPMRWLGEISFGFYLCQGVTIFYARRLLGDTDGYSTPIATTLVIAFFLVTLLGGWALYAGVEQPMMRRWASPRRSTPSPATNPSGGSSGPADGAPTAVGDGGAVSVGDRAGT